jgi:hypothetical protein
MNRLIRSILILSFAFGCALQATAKVTVQYPTDLLSPDFSVPITLKIDQPAALRRIQIRGQRETFMTINLPENNPIYEIGTRFTLVDDVIGVTTTNSSAKTITQGFRLNAPKLARVPQDRGDTERRIGERNILFEKKGVGYLVRQKPGGGEVHLLIQNAVSQDHFVKKVVINLLTPSGMKTVEIEGSPFWFEPMIIIKGDFQDASVMSVTSE